MTDYQKVLTENFGFSDPSRWVEYARENEFTSVKFTEIKVCPFCQSSTSTSIGQFVYYSTLHSLKECSVCRLCFVNVLVEKNVRIEHFEKSYKEIEYFKVERSSIFDQTVSIVKEYHTNPLSILDIGGATGELGVLLKKHFKNSEIIINDISVDSCSRAKEKGLNVIVGDISAINEIESCSVILALDVLYYEPEIRDAFETIYNKLEPGGIFIARMPNKYWLIKMTQYFKMLKKVFMKKTLETRLGHFNPEHLFIMRQSFFEYVAKSTGFAKPKFIPSTLLKKKKYWLIPSFIYSLSVLIFKASGFVVGPAKYIIFVKPSVEFND